MDLQEGLLAAYSRSTQMPKGHSATDKALPWHTGGRDSNPDTTKAYSAPILSGTHANCTLSHNACCHVLQRDYLRRGGKQRGIMVKSSQRHL